VGQNTTTYSYDPASNLATVTYPNGLSSTFTYDSLNRLKSMNGYTYQLGATGNRTSASEQSGRAVNWSYDGIYRLTNETISLDPHSNNGSVTYGLDPVGNRLNQNSTLPGITTGSATFDTNDRLSTETYDANGNTLATGPRMFVYDFENRLKSMNNGAVTIVYDGDGNRIAKTANGATTRYLVDDLNPTGWSQVVEETLGSTVRRTYSYGLQRISQTQLINGAWVPSFYGCDGAGTARTLTDASGTVTDTYDYDAWGNIINTTGSTPNVYLYRGEQYDADLSLYYLRARYYNPLTGRFSSRDPYAGEVLNPLTLHKYLYSGSDPVDLSDPSGMLYKGPVTTKSPGRVMTEYTLLVMVISSPFAAMLMPDGPVNISARTISCIWQYGGSWLTVGALAAAGNIPAAVANIPNQCEEEPEDACAGAKAPSGEPYIRCGALGPDWGSEGGVFSTIAGSWQARKSGQKDKVRIGPCGLGKGFEPGNHINVLSGNNSLGSYICCSCCDSSTGKAIIKRKCKVDNIKREDY
jgi:RHS repeat-associated protein